MLETAATALAIGVNYKAARRLGSCYAAMLHTLQKAEWCLVCEFTEERRFQNFTTASRVNHRSMGPGLFIRRFFKHAFFSFTEASNFVSFKIFLQHTVLQA